MWQRSSNAFSEVASEDARKEIHRLACKIYRKAKVFKSVEKQVVFRSAASHAMENCASGKLSRLSDALACHSRCAEMLWDLRVSEENSSSDSNKVMNRSCEAVRRIVNRMGGLRGILNSISVKEDLTSLLRSVIAANGVSVRILSESDKKEEQQKALSVFCEIKEILRIVPDVTAILAFDVALRMSMESNEMSLRWSEEAVQIASRFGEPEMDKLSCGKSHTFYVQRFCITQGNSASLERD